MTYRYEDVSGVAARALLEHPEFETRLRPLLDQMCDAIRRGETSVVYRSPAHEVARELYDGRSFAADLFVMRCSREARAENYKRTGVSTAPDELRRGDVVVGVDGVEWTVLDDPRVSTDARGRTVTALRLRGVREESFTVPHWSKVRRLRREGESTNA